MSPVQRAEDPARNLHSVWLGPTNAWRWPFDATYTEWGIGFAVFPLAFGALWLVLPLGVLMILGSLALGRGMAGRIDRDLLARATWTDRANARRRGGRVLTGMAFVLLLALFPAPATWLLPMSWWLAAPGAVYVAFRTVRSARPWVDGNRPVTYWLATLRGIARGPRRRREPLALAFGDDPEINDTPLDDGLLDFLARVAEIDPKEVRVTKYRERTPVVEAATFDSSTGREATCGAVVAWLRSRGVEVKVLRLSRQEIVDRDGSTLIVPFDVVLDVAGTEVTDGTVITLTQHGHPGFVPVDEFSERFERVESA